MSHLGQGKQLDAFIKLTNKWLKFVFLFLKKFLGIAIVSLFHPNIIICVYISKPNSDIAVCSLDTN